MTDHNAENERIKRRYYSFLKEAKRQSEATVDAVAEAIARFEGFTRQRSFKAFHYEQAIAFKRHLSEQTSRQTGQVLSKATMHSTGGHLKRFFHWLATQPGYKSHLNYCDAEYFNVSEKDARVATARRDQRVATIEQIRHVLAQMPSSDEIECRNRAIVAFTLLTGARDSAIASLKLKHVDLVGGYVSQDAREVRTKFSKTFTTWFFPVGPEVRKIVSDWVNFLRVEKLWGHDDPLFPSTSVKRSAVSKQFGVTGIERAHWANAAAIRSIFRNAFHNAGLPYFNPHSFRSTLVRLGEAVCRSPEEFKGWSQNLGHEGVMTTFTYYGQIPSYRQGEIMRRFLVEQPIQQHNVEDIMKAVEQLLHRTGAR